MGKFGELRAFAPGEPLWTVGAAAPGRMMILAGKATISECDKCNNVGPISTQGPGNFQGELAFLSGQPALVDAVAQEPLEVLIIAPEGLRALMVADADLGERIMRAVILRRMAILQAALGGSIILGKAENGDVLRLQSFLRRNSHPYQLLNPATDASAKVLIDRFRIDPAELPIVLCPSGQLMRNPCEYELA